MSRKLVHSWQTIDKVILDAPQRGFLLRFLAERGGGESECVNIFEIVLIPAISSELNPTD